MPNPIIDQDGNKRWHDQQGQRHREDGPAFEAVNGSKEWWLNGKQYTEEEYVMIQFIKGVNVYV